MNKLLSWKNNRIEIELYIESGDEPIRFRFGDTESHRLIQDNLDLLKIQIAELISMI